MRSCLVISSLRRNAEDQGCNILGRTRLDFHRIGGS